MAEINESLKEKYEATQKDFEQKIRRHRRAILYRAVIGVAIVAALIASAYYNYQKMVYSDYDVLSLVTYPEASNARYIKFGQNVLRYSQDGASAFNIADDMLWNETFEMQNPLVDSCGDYVALGDYMGTTIYVYNSLGLQGTIDTSTPLKRFCVSGNGNVAVVLEDDEVTWIKLFDVNGTNIASDRTTMSKSGYPVCVDISEDGILMAVSYLFVDSGVLSSSVAYYNFGAVGQNEVDNLVSGYNSSGTVVSLVNFINADTSIAVGDNRFSIYKGSEKPESIFEKELDKEVLSVFYNENKIALVYEDEDGANKFIAEVYDDKGNIVTTQGFDMDYSNISLYKDLLVIYNSEACQIYNTSGLLKYDGKFAKSAVIVIPEAAGSRFLVVYGDGMEEIKLK
ncbi:MAG: hypothetical protein IKO16_00920 [Lachnospiraceae bacterium]|nr:hypothetical protein [Lachnospiraceae bacterium]